MYLNVNWVKKCVTKIYFKSVLLTMINSHVLVIRELCCKCSVCLQRTRLAYKTVTYSYYTVLWKRLFNVVWPVVDTCVVMFYLFILFYHLSCNIVRWLCRRLNYLTILHTSRKMTVREHATNLHTIHVNRLQRFSRRCVSKINQNDLVYSLWRVCTAYVALCFALHIALGLARSRCSGAPVIILYMIL